MEWEVLEQALKHERELRERLERRVERLERLDTVKMIGFISVGILISAMPELIPVLRALVP